MTPDWLKQLAEACWEQTDPKEQLPPRIPDMDELTVFAVNDTSQESRDECFKRLSALPQTESNAAALDFDVAAIHAAWLKHGRPNELKHPLVPLIKAWQREAKPDTRRTGIYPSALEQARVRVHTPELFAADVYDVNGHDAPLGAVDTAWLPGMAPPESSLEPNYPLRIYDWLGGESLRQGRGAPAELRIFVEALMLLWQEDRHMRRRIRVTLGDLRDWLYPNEPERYEPNRITKRIRKALLHVDHMRVDATLPGAKAATLWRPVSITAYPYADLRSPVVFDVELPPGSSVGALVDRHALRLVGVQSALKFRALLGLYFLWNRYGTHNGKRILSTRPVVARNHDGMVVDKAGRVVTDDRGRPRQGWRAGILLNDCGNPTDLAHAARERNPAIDRYPVLTNDDLLTLCYPQSEVAKTQRNRVGDTSTRRRKRLHDARKAIRDMERDGFLSIEEDALDQEQRLGWRILPPEKFFSST